MTDSTAADVALLSRGRPRRTFSGSDVVLDVAGADAVHLLLSGTARLEAETPLGPHPVATLNAPTLFDLRHALDGPPELARVVPSQGSEAAVIPSADARGLLFEPGEEGQAFRRVALGSVAAALRDTNASLTRFFDSLASSAPKSRDSGEYPAMKTVPLDPARVYDLFDAAGLNPSGLPDLGLVARTLVSEAALMKAGARGEESYLLAEGRLRVSMRIPGVGEEALAILGPGEIVGEMALIDDAPRSADVRAHGGPALVYVLSRAVFRRLLESGDPAGAPLLAGIAVALTRRHEEAIRKSATFRVLAGPF